MAQYLYANNARSSLLGNVAPTDPAITLPNGDGALFPMPGSGKTFLLTIEDNTGNIEIVECTARTADTLTVTRGREGTLARAFSASTLVEMRITAGMLGNIDWTAFAGVANGVATLDGDAKLPIAQFDTPLQVYGDNRWNAKLGFTPVQQGGGAGQLTNKVYVGWNGADVTLQVDATGLGAIASKTWVASSTVANANKLTNARNIGISGVVTGNAGFDGSGNINIVTTMPNGAIGVPQVLNLQATLDTKPTINTTNNASITFTGTITGGAVVDNSDIRIKENVEPMSVADAWSIIDAVEGFRFFNTLTKRDEFGVVADRVENAVPEIVTIGKDARRLKAVAYSRLVVPLCVVLSDLRRKGVV